ncbi:hypothetical protein [Turicimonas muris]|nr:hypothetical protein [Turicimonas muris]
MLEIILSILAVLASLINGLFLWIVGNYVIDRILEERQRRNQ